MDVVVAFYPFEFVAERVSGQEVESLTAPGAEPHDLELSPRQLIDIAEADLVVYQEGFQPALDEAVAAQASARVVDVADLVTLQPVEQHREDGEDSHAEQGEGAEAGHEGEAESEHAGEDGHDAEGGGLDPHTWLDPTAMVTVTEAVAAELAAADPGAAADINARAEALVKELAALDQDFAEGLQRCDRREFISSHSAFGYVARRYNLTEIGIAGISPDAEPSPARIAVIHDEAREHQITTVFYETLAAPDVAEAIAGDLGLTTDVLDPLEGLTDQSRGDDYLSVQAANLQALRTANGCS